MEYNTKVTPIAPIREDETYRILHLKFDCIATALDYGIRRNKNATAQWFRLDQRLTLEFLRNSDEYTIGRAIKHGLSNLEEAIEKYENNQP